MNKLQEQVTEFHKAFGVPVNETAQLIDRERMLLRAKLIMEETSETIAAMGMSEWQDTESKMQVSDFCGTPNLVEIADGLMDLLYVTVGACIEFGIDVEKGFNCVHKSNMSKMWTKNEVDEENYGAQDCDVTQIGKHPFGIDYNGTRCFVVKRNDGKIVKSPSYSPADLRTALGIKG